MSGLVLDIAVILSLGFRPQYIGRGARGLREEVHDDVYDGLEVA